MHDVIAILLDTGARYNEIAMLQWNQVDLKNRTVELWRKKTSAESFIFMTDRVHQILQRRASAKMHPLWVFTNWKRTNVRVISRRANRIKSDGTLAELIAIVTYVATHHVEKV